MFRFRTKEKRCIVFTSCHKILLWLLTELLLGNFIIVNEITYTHRKPNLTITRIIQFYSWKTLQNIDLNEFYGSNWMQHLLFLKMNEGF